MLCLPVFDTLALPGNRAGLPAILLNKHRRLTATHRQQAGSYKELPPLPRRSWPASDSSPEASPIDRRPSPAGRLLQRSTAKETPPLPCRSWPASDSPPEALPVDRRPSPAGRLLQKLTSHAGAVALNFALALSMGLLCLTAAQAQTQAQGLAPSPATAPGTGQDKLIEASRQWVAQTQQLAPAQVRFAALDSRVKVEACEQPLEMDYPFNPSRDTVRVRCPQAKSWQVFLRLLPVINTNPGSAAATGKNPINPLTPPISPAAATAEAGTPAVAAAAVQPVALVVTRPVVVTRRLVQRGTLLDSSMLEVIERPAKGLDPLAVTSLKDVELAESMRDIPAGTVLRSYDIKRSLMVKKGQSAMLTVGQGSGFTVRVGVEAQQDGHMGEQIRLKNTESGRLLSGVVTGPNAVRALQN